LAPGQEEGKVFGYQIIVLEDDAEIQLEVDFEISRLQRWTSEKSRKSHVNRNLDFGTHIAVTYLKVLDFS
jgi:hypothetical protein